MSVVWQTWRRKNSLLSPSDDYVTTINIFPIVAKREVKKEWKTGRDGFHPKLKQQVLCLSASKRTIKANHVLTSRPSNTLDVYSSERDQGFAWKQLVACCLRLWKLHWARIQDSSADGIGMRCCIFCKNLHCRSGLFFELLGSQPRVHGYVLWQLWCSVLSPGCPVRAPPITSSSVLERVGACHWRDRQEACPVGSDLPSLLAWAGAWVSWSEKPSNAKPW